MVEETKYCSGMMKKHFNKELWNFESSTKCWICDNTFAKGDVKVRGYCHVTGKYSGTAQRDCNTNVNLSYVIPIVYKFKKLWCILICKNLASSILKLQNRLEKC